jgi:hypothetical protein
MITKYAQVEQILEVKSSRERLGHAYGEESNSGLQKFAALNNGVREEDGYLYVRCRAISSRVNKNNDGWPSEELMKAHKSFVGRPIFVDHNNDDPKRTRGVIVSADVRIDDDKTSGLDPYYATAPDNHKPPTWIELLMEVDAKTFPRLAKAIRKGDIDAVSMGANIDLSKCSVCDNEATTPSEYCNHIKQKGTTFEITGSDGERIRKKAYEDCYGIVFFEESFVFDPADETADILSKAGTTKEASIPEWFQAALEVSGAVGGVGALGLGAMAGSLWAEYRSIFGENPKPIDVVVQSIKSLPDMFRQNPGDPINDMRDRNSLSSMVGKSLPMERVAALKLADLAEQFVKPVGTEDVPPHDRNYQPQTDMTTAPQKVDTLREETRCPICHAADMESDPDGIKRCPICGHVQEPEPVDNPDLGIARDVDLRQDVTQQTTPEGDKEVSTDGLSQETDNITFQAVDPVRPVGATNYNSSSQGIGEMFKTKLRTESKEEADQILPARAGRVETKLSHKIHPGIYRAVADAGLKARFIYPAVQRADNFVEVPGANGFMNDRLALESMRTLGQVDLREVPFIIEADSQEDADKINELIKATQPESADARAARAVQAAGVVELDGRRYRLVEVEDAATPEDLADEEVEEDEKDDEEESKTADRRHIVRTERGADGVERSEEIVEESDGSTAAPEASAEEEKVKPEDLGNVLVPEEAPPALVSKVDDAEKLADEREAKLLASFKLADLSVELGVIEEDDKMALIAETENESIEQIEARAKTLESVKTAGLVRRGSVVKQVPGLRRVPRLSHTVPMVSSNGIDSTPDEALYL